MECSYELLSLPGSVLLSIRINTLKYHPEKWQVAVAVGW